MILGFTLIRVPHIHIIYLLYIIRELFYFIGILSPQEEELKNIILEEFKIEKVNHLRRLMLTKQLKELIKEN